MNHLSKIIIEDSRRIINKINVKDIKIYIYFLNHLHPWKDKNKIAIIPIIATK